MKTMFDPYNDLYYVLLSFVPHDVFSSLAQKYKPFFRFSCGTSDRHYIVQTTAGFSDLSVSIAIAISRESILPRSLNVRSPSESHKVL